MTNFPPPPPPPPPGAPPPTADAKPPFWKRRWFIITAVIIIGLTIWGSILGPQKDEDDKVETAATVEPDPTEPSTAAPTPTEATTTTTTTTTGPTTTTAPATTAVAPAAVSCAQAFTEIDDVPDAAGDPEASAKYVELMGLTLRSCSSAEWQTQALAHRGPNETDLFYVDADPAKQLGVWCRGTDSPDAAACVDQ